MSIKLLTAIAVFTPGIVLATPTPQNENIKPVTERTQDPVRKVRVYSFSDQHYVGLVLFKKNKKNTPNKDIIKIEHK